MTMTDQTKTADDPEALTSLFLPTTIGEIALGHRIVMAPLTRSRSTQPGDVPNDLMRTYYGQRASEGGLIVGEATSISPSARGWYGAPGLYSDEQVEGWSRITQTVHAKGGRMFAQLWHTGRASHVDVSGFTPVSASLDPAYWTDPEHIVSTPNGWLSSSPHRALDAEEIAAVVDDYRTAAERAKAAGFDGIELHGANGYLIDQFLQNGSNKRGDRYGGSIENRSRLLLEVVDAMVSVFGGGRTAVRLGPGGRFNGMGDSNSQALFDHVVTALNGYDLAYLHLIEPRVKGSVVEKDGQGAIAAAHFRKLFRGRIVAAGGFTPESAAAVIARGDADLVAFGRFFVSNPDLVERIRRHRPLNRYNRDTFYTFDARGYIDYPVADEAGVAA